MRLSYQRCQRTTLTTEIAENIDSFVRFLVYEENPGEDIEARSYRAANPLQLLKR